MSRGVRKNSLFIDDVDRRKFLRLLATTVERCGCLCFAYCLMSNHFHLIIQTARPNISRFLHYLDGEYAKFFNRRHKFTGHVYERRGETPLIESGVYLGNAIAYVARNPVAAGIVRDAADWKWSSYAATLGKCACPRFLSIDWLPEIFKAEDLESSRRLLSMAVHADEVQDLPGIDIARGSAEFRGKVRQVIGATLYKARLPRSFRAMAQPPLNQVFAGVRKSERRTAILRAHVVDGYLLSEIARYLDLHPTTVSRIVHRTGSYR